MKLWRLIFLSLLIFGFFLVIILCKLSLKDISLNVRHHSLFRTKFNDVVKPFLNTASIRTLRNYGNINSIAQRLIARGEKRNDQKQEDVTLTIEFRKDITEKVIPKGDFTKELPVSISKWGSVKDNTVTVKPISKKPQNQKIKSPGWNRPQSLRMKKRRRFQAKVEHRKHPVRKHFKYVLRKEKANKFLTESEISYESNLLSRLLNPESRTLPEDDLKSSETNEKFLVPNIVHYVWLSGGQDLKFHEMLGMLSAQKYIKPDYLKLHCDKEPTGIWWNMYKVNLTSLKIVHIDSDIKINGVTPTKIQVKSDIARIRILQKEGGIYIDFDVFVIQSFDDLRKYEFTLGLEYHGEPGRINNGIIIAAPNARFFNVWLDSYKDFRQDEWDEHSCIGPYLLAPKYPSLVNVDENRLNYPSGRMFHLIYYNNYNWTRNYAMHLWFRKYRKNNPPITDFNPKNIKTLNSTFGQLARRILYNTTDIMKK